MQKLKVGDVIWLIQDFGTTAKLIHGEILNISKQDEIKIASFHDKTYIFYIHQQNITITKNKRNAKLIYIAKLCNKRDLEKNFEQIVLLIKEKTGLIDTIKIKKEIENSQYIFPELWV